jgi:hypothetical protein
MLNNLKVGILVFVFFISGCAGNYKTSSGKQRNAWVDLLVVAAAVPSSSDSAATRARKSGFVNGYLSEEDEEDDYEANCACPYNRASDNTRCGARSAWTKPEAESPRCDNTRITSDDYLDRYDARKNSYNK